MLDHVKIEESTIFSCKDDNDVSFSDDGKPWSRVYGYPWAVRLVEKFCADNNMVYPRILNAAWGFQGCHVIFRRALDDRYRTIHTDILNEDEYLGVKIKSYSENPTFILDLCRRHSNFNAEFDVTLCISVLEHLPAIQSKVAVENLISYTKPGGIIGITYDIPSESAGWLIETFGTNYAKMNDDQCLTGANSVLSNPVCKDLKVGSIVLRKI